MPKIKDKTILEEHAYWHEFADKFGMAVFGWSYKDTCTLLLPSGYHLQITGEFRDLILNQCR